MTRRTALQLLPLPLALGRSLAAARPYRLGCQTLPYQNLPLPRAIEGIRKAGYRYIQVYQRHAGRMVFAPETPRAELDDLRQRLKDAGLEMFCGFVGLRGALRKPENFTLYLKELDLAREFGVRTVVSIGPSYYTKFPGVPKRASDWEKDVAEFLPLLERVVRHAASLGVTITIKPHTGLACNGKAGLELMRRLPDGHLKICWDAGNVSFYEGIHPDPDLPDLAPHVKAVCIKDHRGLRANADFPVPGQGQIDHELMFKILFGAGFDGPISVERIDGTDNAMTMPAELIDARIQAARAFLMPLLDKLASRT
jgi:sugar phosphate isomerase/epimerase